MKIISLNNFRTLLLNPLSDRMSSRDRKICLVASICLGILTAGILHLSFALYAWSTRKVEDKTDRQGMVDPLVDSPVSFKNKMIKACLTDIQKDLNKTLKKIENSKLDSELKASLISNINNTFSWLEKTVTGPKEGADPSTPLNELSKQLLACIRMEHVQPKVHEEQFLNLLGQMKSINRQVGYCKKSTVLHTLAKVGRPIGFVKVLAEKGINFDQQDFQGNSALIWAIANGKNSMAFEILNYQQNLNLKGSENTALYLAIAKGYTNTTFDGEELTVSNLDLVKKLLEKGAQVDLTCKFGLNALHLACVRRDPRMIEALLNAGGGANIKTQKGKSCLELLNGTYEEAKKLLLQVAFRILLPESDFNENLETCKTLIEKANS